MFTLPFISGCLPVALKCWKIGQYEWWSWLCQRRTTHEFVSVFLSFFFVWDQGACCAVCTLLQY